MTSLDVECIVMPPMHPAYKRMQHTTATQRYGTCAKNYAAYYCNTLLQHTIAIHYCNTQLHNTVATYYCDTFMPHMASAQRPMQHTTAAYYCNTLLQQTVVTRYAAHGPPRGP